MTPDLILSHELIAEAVSWRHHLHRHPELAYRETHTADWVATQLARFGLSVHRGLAGTGVVGTLSRGSSRRTLGIRADMDALPIQEHTSLGYASGTPNVMHACGHDGHVAIALAAARACAQLPDLDGTVHFIFQPAEENEGGGRLMVEEGLFRRFPCDVIYALHNWPTLPLGMCVARDGAMMAALALFEVVVRGRGSHGAMPHEGTDVILAASQIVGALQSIISRNVSPLATAVVSATQIRAGDTWNVLPEECTIRGTTRWLEESVGDLLETRLSQVAHSIAAALGCTVQFKYERRLPATINNPQVAQFVRRVASTPSLGLTVMDPGPSLASEDFAFMLQAVPGCYFWLGAASSPTAPPLHSPHYDFNDELIPIAVRLWTALVRQTLACAELG